MGKFVLAWSLSLAWLWCAPSTSRAVTPFIPSDRELASMPVVVIAHWRKGPFHVYKHKEASGTAREWEERWTEIDVEKSVWGELPPGTYRVLLSGIVTWAESGRPAARLYVYDTGPEVEDVTKSAMWFLSFRQSTNPDIPGRPLFLVSGNAIEPLSLRRYYEVLRKPDRDEKIGDLLRSTDRLTVLRSLGYIAGKGGQWSGTWSWRTFGTWRESARWSAQVGEPVEPLYRHAPSVRLLLISKDTEIRRTAAAVYAWLTADRRFIRSLLRDNDPEVRKIAEAALKTQQGPGPGPYSLTISLSGAFAADFDQVNRSVAAQLRGQGFELARDDRSLGPRSIDYRCKRAHDGFATGDFVCLFQDMRYRLPQFHEPYTVVGYDAPGWVSVQVTVNVLSTNYRPRRRWIDGLFGGRAAWVVRDDTKVRGARLTR